LEFLPATDSAFAISAVDYRTATTIRTIVEYTLFAAEIPS
jgi:hypothetical protein